MKWLIVFHLDDFRSVYADEEMYWSSNDLSNDSSVHFAAFSMGNEDTNSQMNFMRKRKSMGYKNPSNVQFQLDMQRRIIQPHLDLFKPKIMKLLLDEN